MGSINFNTLPTFSSQPDVPGSAIGWIKNNLKLVPIIPISDYRFVMCAGANGGVTSSGMSSNPTTSGTLSIFNDGTWHFTKFLTTAVIGGPAGLIQSAAKYFYSQNSSPTTPSNHSIRIKTSSDISSQRIWLGLCSTDITYGSGDLGTGHIAAVRYSTTAGDTTFQFVTRDGAATNIVNTGVTVSPDTIYDFRFFCSPSSWSVYVSTNQFETYIGPISSSTNVPDSATALGFINRIYTTVASSRFFLMQSNSSIYK